MPPLKADWHKKGNRVHKFEIEIEYVHNLKELYKRLYFWLSDNGWKDLWGGDSYEVRYWQRDLPGGGMHEHHIWWRAWKHPGSRNHNNELFKYFFKIDYQTIAATRQEIMHKGQKWKLDRSNTIMRVESHLIVDWDEKAWEKGFLAGIKDTFRQWHYRDKVDEETGKLYDETVKLQNLIKDFIELETDKEADPNVYPPNMLP